MTTPESRRFQEAADVRLSVFRLARRLRAERVVDQMSDTQHLVLNKLYSDGPMPLGELAAHERVTAPSMNRTVNHLEELGYATRVADSVDRRKVLVEITEAGSTMVEEVKRVRTGWLAGAMEELTEEEKQKLIDATAVMNRVAAL